MLNGISVKLKGNSKKCNGRFELFTENWLIQYPSNSCLFRVYFNTIKKNMNAMFLSHVT